MYTCSSLLKIISLQLILIFISLFMTACEADSNFLQRLEKTYCPFIQTLSFGSDIDIKCNSSYLIFNELNSDTLNWKFANQTPNCGQNGAQQAHINQCGVSLIDLNYLRVSVKSSEHNEKACIYCRINYKPIAPLISVVQSDEGHHILYTFNITATGLKSTESFEILWAKRVSDEIRHSFNYWFSQKCIDSIVRIVDDTSHTIIFTVDDVAIERVEFIIRRCNGTCRQYEQCLDQYFLKDISSNDFQTPDSIEKISCNSDCLYGILTAPILPITDLPFIVPASTTTQYFNPEPKIKLIILIITVGCLLIIALVIFILYALCRVNGSGKKHVYIKTNNADPDEHR